jgi:hypothetical protein
MAQAQLDAKKRKQPEQERIRDLEEQNFRLNQRLLALTSESGIEASRDRRYHTCVESSLRQIMRAGFSSKEQLDQECPPERRHFEQQRLACVIAAANLYRQMMQDKGYDLGQVKEEHEYSRWKKNRKKE